LESLTKIIEEKNEISTKYNQIA